VPAQVPHTHSPLQKVTIMADPVHAVLLSGSGLILAATATVTDATDALSRPEQVAVLSSPDSS